jgi:hypothetical protein
VTPWKKIGALPLAEGNEASPLTDTAGHVHRFVGDIDPYRANVLREEVVVERVEGDLLSPCRDIFSRNVSQSDRLVVERDFK